MRWQRSHQIRGRPVDQGLALPGPDWSPRKPSESISFTLCLVGGWPSWAHPMWAPTMPLSHPGFKLAIRGSSPESCRFQPQRKDNMDVLSSRNRVCFHEVLEIYDSPLGLLSLLSQTKHMRRRSSKSSMRSFWRMNRTPASPTVA